MKSDASLEEKIVQSDASAPEKSPQASQRYLIEKHQQADADQDRGYVWKSPVLDAGVGKGKQLSPFLLFVVGWPLDG